MTDETRSRRKPGATGRARSLRRGGNIAEARLWNDLKDRKLGGYEFVRQFPLGEIGNDPLTGRFRGDLSPHFVGERWFAKQTGEGVFIN